MRGLLVKDFRLLRQRIRFFGVLLVVAVFMSFSKGGSSVMVSYLTMVTALFSVSTVSYDEYDNCYCFLMTLPIDRRTYTREKYLFGALLCLGAWLIGAVLQAVSLVSQGQQAALPENLMESLVYIPLCLILISLILPFQLKYGMERGRLALLAVAGLAAVVIWTARELASKMGLSLGNLLSSLSGIGGREILLACFLLGGAVTGISYGVSERIMRKKEL